MLTSKMEAQQWNFGLFDDDDEDLGTFIANSRLRRDGDGDGGHLNGVSDFDQVSVDRAAPEQTPHMDDQLNPQVEVRKILLDSPSYTKEAKEQRQHVDLFGYGNVPLEVNESESPLGDFPQNSSPIRLPEGHQDSPLFVSQEESVSPMRQRSRSLPLSRYIASEYNHYSLSARPAPPVLSAYIQHSDPTRQITMKNAFDHAEYVRNIRKNPYTTGIFNYHGLPKDAYKGITTQSRTRSRDTKQAVSGTNPKRVTRLRDEISPADHNGQPHSAHAFLTSAIDPLLQPAPGKRLRVDSIDRTRSPNRRSQEQLPESLSATPRLGSNEDQIQTAQTIVSQAFLARTSKSNDGAVIAFLKEQIKNHETCLSKIECYYDKDNSWWQRQEVNVQPDVETFVQEFSNEQNFKEDEFKLLLQAWDMDKKVQVIAQKYLMYTALLKKISST